MVMPPCGTFNYLVEVPADPLAPWQARELKQPEPTGDELWDSRLVGLNPLVLVEKGLLILQAQQREGARHSAASLRVDPRLLDSIRPHDQVHLVRTGAAGLGLSVVRDGRLVVA